MQRKSNATLKKILCLLLCAVITVPLVVSCAKNDGVGQESTAVSTTGTEDDDPYSDRGSIPDDLPDENYEGADFRIYLRSETNNNTDFFAEKETGDLVNDAVFARNLAVSERFNVNIKFNFDSSGNTTYTTTAVTAILADEDANDVLGLHGAFAFNHAKQGYLLDWKTDLPFVNLEKPWWDQDFVENMAMANRLFAMTGDISHLSVGSTFCLVFNKKLFEQYRIDYPYASVLDNSWTFEKFSKIVKDSSIDLNGDSKQTPGADLYGLHTGIWSAPIQIFYSAGDRVITIDDNGEPSITVFTERTVDIFTKFFDLIDNYNCFVVGISSAYEGDMFRSDLCMFSAASMGALVSLRDMESDIGVIPYPKYNDSVKEYYSLVDAGQNVFSVPVTVREPERVSVILEAFAAQGYRKVVPTFYEEALQIKYARDDDSAGMLDIIRDGRIFDYGYYDASISWDLSYIGRNLLEHANHDFASYYNSRQKAADKELGKLYEQYLK